MLFDDFQRSNRNPPEHGEPLYPFLNSAAGAYWQSVRDILTEWLSAYPLDEQPTLISRFRRTDRRGFLGAFWELYLHELFRRLGFRIELHPEVAAATHRPDFRLQRGTAVIYVEAVTIYEPWEYSRDDPRLALVRDAVGRVSSPRFRLSVDARQIASTALPLQRLSRALESWLGTLEAESESSQMSPPDSVFKWQESGWVLIFRPIPRGATIEKPPGRRDLEADPVRTRSVDDARIIRTRLSGKSRAYGRRFDQSFLIALMSYRPSHGPEAVLRGLFGAAWTDPEMLRDRVIRRSRLKSPNGLWLTNKGVEYRDVSAVLAAFDVMPWSIARGQPWLIANPWASHPLEIELPFNRFDIDPASGAIVPVATGFEPHRLFGRQPGWPPDVK
ncbi:MAG TPA: hypothetical protein VFI42_05200 [Thermomicrobiaceae bacterium]|nr:hypothetical protein [Thermomicrobiaceae bacterium]